MKFIRLKHFKSGPDLCGDDFENKESVININPQFLLSFTDLLRFTLPFSGKLVGKYSVIEMSNGDRYYLNEEQFNKFNK